MDESESTYTPMADGGPPSSCDKTREAQTEDGMDSSNSCSSTKKSSRGPHKKLNEEEISAKKCKTESMNPDELLESKYGYCFDTNGELVHKETREKFNYEYYDKKSKNQERYEDIGNIITDVVYKKLECELQLNKYDMEGNIFNGSNSEHGFLFATKDFREKDKILILIHGSGVVRAGQWSRRLIINDNLKTGTQFDYIKKGIEENFGVIVLNTNHNKNNDGEKLHLSENPEKHGENVWKNFIKNLENIKVAIVAHSFAGVVTSAIAKKYKKSFEEKVFAVAFTDAIDYGTPKFLKNRVKNWVTSKEKLGSQLSERSDGVVETVSAGTTTHEETSAFAFEEVFNFISLLEE